MGLAFQIRDDLLNLVSSFEDYGKEINGDILEGKPTVMLIHLLENSSKSERVRIEAILKKVRSKKKVEEVRYIRDLMDRYRSIEFAQSLSTRNANGALRILDVDCGWMTNKLWKHRLRELAKYVIVRNK